MNEIKEIVSRLCSFGSRPVNTDKWEEIRHVLKDALIPGINVDLQSFQSPTHFLQVLLWLIGGFLFCLILVSWLPLFSLILALLLLILAVLYFDWRSSAITRFPPQVSCQNFIANNNPKTPSLRIILMAHWDTAPITFPYRPSMIKGFRASVFSAIVFMSLVLVVVGISSIGVQMRFLLWAKAILIVYFLIQLFIVFVDFWKYGYSNGANDNASGCAAAISAANRLWQKFPHAKIELCITGAEEVGMIGSKYYYHSIKADFLPTYVVNFDTVGCEHLQVITRSGTFSVNSYEGELMDRARSAAKEVSFPINFGKYETADVDTVWFARGGIPAITVISHDDEGLPAHIHRPEDRSDKLHWDSIQNAADFAVLLCENLIKEKSHA